MDSDSHTFQPEEYLQGRLDFYLGLLERMVAVNSFTLNHAGVDRLGELTAQIFFALGFTAEFISSSNHHYGKHLFLRRAGSGANALVFVSHLDTVFTAEEEKRNGFSWRVEGERVYGPGTIDIKGGTLAMYMLLDVLRVCEPELFAATSWLVALNAAEERGASEFAPAVVDRAFPGTRACLVFEAGKSKNEVFTVVTARKGRAEFRIETTGRAAHSGVVPERGASAIRQLAHVIDRVEAMNDLQRQLSCNVGIIGGGETKNRVPDHAWAEGELRAFEPEALEYAEQELLKLNELSSVSSIADGYPCAVCCKVFAKSDPWPGDEQSQRLFDIWSSTAAEMGIAVSPEARGGLSDINRLWKHFPSLDGLGPSGGNAHCSVRSDDRTRDQEFLWVPSLIPKTLLNLNALKRLLG